MNINRIKIFFLVLAFSVMAVSCSKEDVPTPPDSGTDAAEPYSTRIRDNNRNLPGPGTIYIEFGDFLPKGDLNKAVDGNPDSELITPHKKFYIEYHADEAFLMNRYYLMVGNDPACDPVSWTISVSEDGKTWTVVDTKENYAFESRMDYVEFTIPTSETAYRYYRFDVKANGGSDNTRISEWKLSYFEENPEIVTDEFVVKSNKNLPGSGVLYYVDSDSPEDNVVKKMVDNMKTTSFITSRLPFDIVWRGDEKTAVTIFSLLSSDGNAENDPKSWMISASDDGEQWSVLNTVTDYTFKGRNIKNWYKIIDSKYSNTTKYKYYKLTVTENNGGTFTEIAEMQFLNIDLNIDLLLAKSAAHTDYDNQDRNTGKHLDEPMGVYFLPAIERMDTISQKRLDWLKDPDCEPIEGNPNPTTNPMEVDLFPYGMPKMADANQKAIGDCCAIAVFGSLAYCYPEFVKNSIIDHGNNTFTVKMYDPKANPIDVGVSNKIWPGQCVGKDGNKATWATLYEKALMKYNAVFHDNPNLGGIATYYANAPFTGEQIGYHYNFNSASLTSEEWERIVTVSLINGCHLIGGFWVPNIPFLVGGSITGHAFSFMHCDYENENGVASFAVRNPWGDGPFDGMYPIQKGGAVLQAQTNVWIFEPGPNVSKYPVGVLDPYEYPYN